ncbi:cell division protein FtsL [Mesobacillus harenae]|uniref:cell division protein FtsL n=1 Tax=Mesobacillus harenae TaxID=2213203 RepID=UPI001580FE42|nr:cell division protein FtsL [Mesobacillus harenae]
MSNLARKLQQEQQQDIVNVPKKDEVKKFWLSPGEKALVLMFGVVFCFGGTFLVSNQAAIYEVNKEIQVMETTIQEQQKENSDLTMQIGELSTYERIWEKAKQLGLTLNENNVKVVEN